MASSLQLPSSRVSFKTHGSQKRLSSRMDFRRRRAGEIQNSIRKILLEDWDPIGVGDFPTLEDEYDSYIAGIYNLLVVGRPAIEVAKHLSATEEGEFGFRVSVGQLLPIAEKLCSLEVHLTDDKAT